jgi:hypothetical protein
MQTKYERHLECEQELSTLKQYIHRAKQQILRTSDSSFRFHAPTLPLDESTPKAVNDAQTDSIACVDELQHARTESLERLNLAIDAAIARIDAQIGIVRSAFAEFRQSEYEPKVNKLPPEDREILSTQIQIIEETKILPDVESQCRLLQAEVRSLAEQMYAFCDAICRGRDSICSIRQENVQAINADIATVRLRFCRSANHSGRDSFQKSYSEDAGSFFSFLENYSGDECFQKLRDLFGQMKTIETDENKWNIKDLLWDAKFVELLQVLDDDDVEIDLKVGEAGFVQIQNLSAGQRCTAVFPLLLRNSRGPLVIDQPEDNLDNRYIADVIAPDLLYKKRHQQFIYHISQCQSGSLD